MNVINLYQVDAFTNQMFGGNPAGVVTNGDVLTDKEMMQIAREMNLSETAFVLHPSSPRADMRLRFFTASGDEVKFCGHATIGALFQLAQLNLFELAKTGTNKVRVETDAGILPVDVTNGGELSTRVTFTAPKAELAPYRLQGKAFADEFGLEASLLQTESSILVDAILNYIYIPVTSLKALGDQLFDFSRIREKSSEEKTVVFCFFANETFDPQSDLHARGLAPNVGVDEDPFTGSMQAGLVLAAKKYGYIARDQELIVTEQGHFMDRPGFAEINHDAKSERVRVTGSAVSVFSTALKLAS